MEETPHRKRDPILDPPEKKNSASLWVGLGVAAALHLGVAYYFLQAKFEIKQEKFTDEKVNVDLVAPPPPPIPVPPVPQEKRVEYKEPPAQMNTGTPPPVSPPGPHYVGGDWKVPGSAEMSDSYPDRAANDEVEGTVTIDCAVSASGKVTSCDILNESPKGYGFGAATVKLFIRYAKVAPSSVGGSLRDGDRKKFTYKWQLG